MKIGDKVLCKKNVSYKDGIIYSLNNDECIYTIANQIYTIREIVVSDNGKVSLIFNEIMNKKNINKFGEYIEPSFRFVFDYFEIYNEKTTTFINQLGEITTV